ncbi:ASKHA domain-containing protein [bacterium]|nr:ASKHA domain-containing protein [bacterium]
MNSEKKHYKVEFIPAHKTGHFSAGIAVRDAALELGILIESDCAGIGSCAKCKVEIKKGANPPTPVEQEVLTARELRKGVRLACQSTISADSLYIVHSASGPGEQIMTEGLFGDIKLSPDIRKTLVRIGPSQLGEKYFDFEKLFESLKNRGITTSGYNFQITRDLARVLRTKDHTVTVVTDQGRLLAVESGDTRRILYGVAVDIGTTTVAAKLVDLITGNVVAVNSAANPQAAHGSDVVSRLQYIIQHPGGLKRLNQLIIKLINGLIGNLSDEVGIHREQIYKIVLAGNTVMSHIALNIDPRYLGHKPYTPVFQGPATLEAQALDIKIHPCGVIYSTPNLACFVGSDITAVLTILDLDKHSKYQLAIDMGTNGEMVLGSKDRLLCCSSPAGPAWEGACITWGMRATYGAIERVEIGNGGLLFRTIGDSDPTGICGSGLIDVVCEFLRAGVIDKSGRILDSSQLPTNQANWIKDLIVQREKNGNDLKIVDIGDSNSIVVSQNDIREIQLAKAAIATGVKILTEELEIPADKISTVYIAGAFGNHILARDVLDLGLIPKIPPERIKFIGNAALTGAEAILKSKDARERAEQISRKIEYIDIAGRPEFQENFVDAMHFPIEWT